MHFSRINNFDLLRLLAASQVIFGHTIAHLEMKLNPILSLLKTIIAIFPGVPIFFVTSGFLISASFERNATLRDYFTNRMLRIYPALWIAFFVSLLLISMTGYWANAEISFFPLLKWMIAQLTIAQFYNPPFLRHFGVGVLNGSLWTISVELQFYLSIPILYYFINKLAKKHSEIFLIGLFCLFAFISYLLGHNPNKEVTHSIFYKIIQVTLAPYLYMFLLGIILQRRIESLLPIVQGKFILYFLGYVLLFLSLRNVIQFDSNSPNFFSMLALSFVMLSFAFSYTTLSKILLKENDISYGMYIYHMLIINLLVQYNYKGHLIEILYVYVLTAILAALSWFAIEQSALRLKKRALRQISKQTFLPHEFSTS